MKRLIAQLTILCFAFVLVNTAARAQGTPAALTVQGRVLDQDKKPLHGVTVAEVDAEQRTIRAVKTDVEGNFALNINSKSDSLSFSYIGNETIKQAIGNRTTINVTMRSSSGGLGEVIVSAQRRSDNGLMPIKENA